MKVKELKELLKNIDDERVIVMSRDGEGNGFSPLSGLDHGSTYLADTTWSGEIGIEKLDEDAIDAGFTEDDLNGGVPALVLWPTN